MQPGEMRRWLCGPMVAVATPFAEDYALDLSALQDNIRFLIAHGIRTGQGALLVGGAGGEHPTLTVDERKALMAAAVEAAQGEVPVLTSIQHTDVRVIVELARAAAQEGLQGAQLSPTYYYPPSAGDALRLFEMVAAAADISLMVYHTWWDGLSMDLDLVRRLAEIETVRALKWSAPDEQQFRETMLALADDLVVINTVNSSGHIIVGHLLGARGFISHIANFWPEYPLRLWHLLEQGNYAAARDHLAAFKWRWANWRRKVEEFTGGEGPFIKAAMEAVGLRVGPPRLPSVRPSASLLHELRELLATAAVPDAQVPVGSTV